MRKNYSISLIVMSAVFMYLAIVGFSVPITNDSVKEGIEQTGMNLFSLLSPEETGLNFTNKLEENDSLHVLNYEYLYNGNGIGAGDFNNDGLQDVFISGNTVRNKLFLNKGNVRFEDVTLQAGVAGNGTWSTGVSVADVNGDGLLDIYVCHSGKFPKEKLANELFINQGVGKNTTGIPTFINKAKEYGLDAEGTQSTQAAFFDYDLDGDLDMFLLNHSVITYNPLLNTRKIRSTPSLEYGNRLFRNDAENGKITFTDVTKEVGIVNNAINYGLSVTISDLDGDGWADIYTTSDYTEQDYCYINNKNGTFRETIRKSFPHISQFSMGADIADYNNDLRPDVMTLDMQPEDNRRQKLLKGADEYDQYHLLVDSGYHHQNMRNMLHLNQGLDGRGDLRFSEIGQFAGVNATDWSWAVLFTDMDNDGWKDLFITNGYLRDYTNLDFLKYTVADARLAEAKKGNLKFRTFDLVKKMPSTKLSNYGFRNNGDLTFSNHTNQWGLQRLSVSNSAVYADLDNDGDMDLIVNHQNEPVSVYRNNAETLLKKNYINIRLKGLGENTFAVGAKILLTSISDGKPMRQIQELYPVRGYQSSVDYTLHFGLGSDTRISEVMVLWTDGTVSRLQNVPPNQTLTLSQADAKAGASEYSEALSKQAQASLDGLFTDVSKQSGLDFTHSENDFVDFKSEFLLPYQLSRLGPALAVGDVNGDGLEDVFFGGAMEQQSVLFLQQKSGRFETSSAKQAWSNDTQTDVVNALFFDADGDGDKDLYCVHGGNEAEANSEAYQDKLYRNDGNGNFTDATPALPPMLTSKQAIAASDFDGDGDMDIFVGGRCYPGKFPLAAGSYLLRNDSQGKTLRFTDITASVCKELSSETPGYGMITSAVWQDINGDKTPDLLIAGDWMPLKIFLNERKTTATVGKEIVLRDASLSAGLQNTSGMWTNITASDINGDGAADFIVGNCGNNNPFKASVSQPMHIFVKDFDNNGVIDPILCYYVQGKSYPYPSRDELLEQMTPLRRKFVKYADYADATIENIFPKEQISAATVFTCDYTATSVLMNDGKGHFTIKALPPMAQISKVQGIVADDVNGDGHQDLVVAGNFYSYRTQMGRCDAGLGLVLLGDGKGNFIPQMPYQSGLYAGGDVHSLAVARTGTGGKLLILAKNNEATQVFQWRK